MAKTENITSVITGDIIGSRDTNGPVWLPKLKTTLSVEGKSPDTWQIFRGDSFQVEIKNPPNALQTAIRIKATIKSIKNLDVRMSIGIGKKKSVTRNVAESDGEAFIFSGETFETLKKAKRNLAIKTPWAAFDRDMNVCLNLASITLDSWTPGSAEVVALLIANPTLTQSSLAKKLGVTQPAVSDHHNRSHYETLMELEGLYREKILKLIAAK